MDYVVKELIENPALLILCIIVHLYTVLIDEFKSWKRYDEVSDKWFTYAKHHNDIIDKAFCNGETSWKASIRHSVYMYDAKKTKKLAIKNL